MKVCTDTCLFGSLLPASSGREDWLVLDVGTGTGLLALMYAQKNANAIIDAVEIDEAASQQAKENFEASPWRNRLKVYHTSIQNFSVADHENNILSKHQLIKQSTKYNLIISNPPFYENDLKSNNEKRNLALHSGALNFEELISAVEKHLANDGVFAVMLPFHRSNNFENLAVQHRFYLNEKILVKQTSAGDYFRTIMIFTKEASVFSQKKIIIYNRDTSYTNLFVHLLKDYYLYL